VVAAVTAAADHSARVVDYTTSGQERIMREDVKVWGARIGLWACGMFVVPAVWWWLQGKPDHPAAGYVTLAIVLTGSLTFFSVLVTIAAVLFGPGMLINYLRPVPEQEPEPDPGPPPTPKCTCVRVEGTKRWTVDCEVHGYGTEWWNRRGAQ
jgi:hypothetical protein